MRRHFISYGLSPNTATTLQNQRKKDLKVKHYIGKAFLLIAMVYSLASCATMSGINLTADSGFKQKENVALEKYQGNILTPEDQLSKGWQNIQVGFEYAYEDRAGWEPNWEKDPSITKVKKVLKSIDSNEYLFDVYYDGKTSGITVIKDSIEYIFFSGIAESWSLFGDCNTFKLGSCDYEVKAGDARTVTVSFENGVWEIKYNFGNSVFKHYKVATKRIIYDKKGLVLYSWTKNDDRLQEEVKYEETTREY